MSNPVGPRAAHPRHRSRQRREGRLRAGRLPRRAATREPLLVVPTFADVDHYRRELAAAGAVFGVRVVAFSGLMREIARRAGVGGQAALAPGARARGRRRDRPGRACEALAASAATPGFVQALLRLVTELEEQRIEPGALVGRDAGVGRARARARRLRRGARAPVRRLSRRPAGHRTAATASCTTRRRSTRCAWSPRAGARRRSSSTASTTCSRCSATRSRRSRSTRARRSPSRWPTSPGARPSPGAARPSRSCMALGARARRAAGAAPSTTSAPRCTRSSARCSSRRPPGAPIRGDALLLLEGGGERAELELVAAHVARLIARAGLAPEDIAVVLREPREHAALLEQVFGALEIPFALERTRRRRAHRARARAASRCCAARWPAAAPTTCSPGCAPRASSRGPSLADRLEQRARVEGAATADAGAGAVGGRPSRLRPARARPRRGARPATRPRCAGAWPPSAARCSPRRIAARRAVLAGPEALDARVAGALRSALGELERLAARRSRARARRPTSSRASCTTSRCAPTTTARPGRRGHHEPAGAARAARAGAPSSAGCRRAPSRARRAPEPFLGDDERRALNAASGLRLRLREDRLDAERYLLYAVASAARPSCSRSAGPRPTTRASRACARCSSTTCSTASTRAPRARASAARWAPPASRPRSRRPRTRPRARAWRPGRARPSRADRVAARRRACCGAVNARATWSASALEA